MKHGALWCVAPAVSGCVWRQGALQPKGPKALAIAELGALFFWISLVVLALVVGSALWAFVRGARHAGKADQPPILPSEQTERQLARAVGASTVVAVVLLAILLISSIATGRNLSAFAPAKPLHIRITGHQWWWKIEYPGATPDQQVVTANELHVPVGQPVELELISADVIHSLWLPNLDGKHDLIPNHVLKTRLQADTPGAYFGRCAEFCGYQHAHMDLILIAQTPTEFAAWLAGQRLPAIEPTTPETERGRAIVEQSPCALCHTISGTRALGSTGPDLSHFASRRSLGAGAAVRNRATLANWLRNPQELKPGNQMPAVELSSADLAAVVDYLESLR